MTRFFTYLLYLIPLLSPLFAQTVYTDYDKYILFHWKGALTSHSIQIKVFPTPTILQSAYETALVLFQKPISVSNIVQVAKFTFTNEAYPVQQIDLTNLAYATQYYYFFVFGPSLSLSNADYVNIYTSNDIQAFPFRTFGRALTPFSFNFGAASCASTGSDSKIFLQIRDENLDFFIHMGDLHYNDINQDNDDWFYQSYYQVFSSPTQKAFYQTTPIAYVWDDHDFGPNDANGKSPSRPAATRTYKRFAPYHPLKEYLPADDTANFPSVPSAVTFGSDLNPSYPSDGQYGIFRSFIVGRCLFIILDLRSFKDDVPNDILGTEQKDWLKNQLVFAGLNEQNLGAVFIVSTVTWIGDTWSNYQQEEKNVADWIASYVQQQGLSVYIIAGDAHMLAFDDGRNNQFGGFPVIQSAAMARCYSCKGGPYSHGIYPGGDQYGTMSVEDDGNRICLKISLKQNEEVKIAYDTCNPDLYEENEMSCVDAYLKMYTPSIVFLCILAAGAIGIAVYFIRSSYDVKLTKILKRAYYQRGLDEAEIKDRIKTFKDEKRMKKRIRLKEAEIEEGEKVSSHSD